MRTEGYYWIKISRNGDWKIAEFFYEDGVGIFRVNNGEIYPTHSLYKEDELSEISENKLNMSID